MCGIRQICAILAFVRSGPTKLNHLLLALFLCLGMIGLSGAGIGRTCVPAPSAPCTCCPMEPGEACCSGEESPNPPETPLLPPTPANQGAFLGVLESRPVLMILPVSTPAEFPLEVSRAQLNSAGPSVQALLCVRTV